MHFEPTTQAYIFAVFSVQAKGDIELQKVFEESAEQIEQLRFALDPGGHVGEAVDHTEEKASIHGTKGVSIVKKQITRCHGLIIDACQHGRL